MTNRDSDILTRAEARLGTVLRGKYRLDRVLGIGGMAVVYKATHRNLAQFAVKLLHPEVSLSADARARFLREGYAANSLKHPGAVLVVDDDVADDGAAFLVMELLDGIGCEEVAERSGNRLAPDAANAIVIQLLDVLAAAHANHIVHRDIKPANLFLTRNGVLKVLDFGIARAREALASGARATGTGMMLGTPAFMAPEQAAGKAREVDGRTDLSAAGATFFSLVSGQLVYEAETAHELLISAATTPPRSLATVAPHVSPALVAVIDRALAFRKEDRWATTQEMREALLKARPSGTPTPEAIVASLIPGSARPLPLPVASTMQSGQEAAPAASAAKAGQVRSGPVVSLTTASPISSDPDGAIPMRGAPSRRWVVGLAVGLALGVVGAVAYLGAHGGSPSNAGPAPVSPTASASPLLLPVVADAAVAASSSAPGPAAPIPPPAPTPSVTATHAPRPAPRPPPKAPAPDCAPNYTLDDQGQKHFKPECFLKSPR